MPLLVGDGHHGVSVSLDDSLREELAYLVGDISHIAGNVGIGLIFNSLYGVCC